VGGVRDLLHETADLVADFLESLPDRRVFPSVELADLRARLGHPLPEEPSEPRSVVAELAAVGGEAAVAIPGGRYFGFVIGGAVPAALAADWLTAAWDQNAGLYVAGPAASVVEEVVGSWLAELLGLPADASYAFVTGTQMAHVTALAAARHHVLAAVGWDVERDGLAGSPPIRVVAGAKRHTTIDRALRFIGLGTGSVVEVPADGQGRMQVEDVGRALEGEGLAIVCAQAGEVNTGAFDQLAEIADLAAAAGAWLHVDGAFGLWAAASSRFAHLTAGAERADSWAVDGHKWERRANLSCPARRPGEWRGVDERDDLGGHAGDPDLGQQLVDERGGRRPDGRCVRERFALASERHVEPHAGSRICGLDFHRLAELSSDPQAPPTGVGRVGSVDPGVRVGDPGPAVLDLTHELGAVVPHPDGASAATVCDRVHRHLVGGKDDLGDTRGRQTRCRRRSPHELPDLHQPASQVEKLDMTRLSKGGAHRTSEESRPRSGPRLLALTAAIPNR
jgi:hypothetical protein